MQLDASLNLKKVPSLNLSDSPEKIIELLQTDRDQMATQMDRTDGICEWL